MRKERTFICGLALLVFCSGVLAQENCGDVRPRNTYWCAFVMAHLDNYKRCPDGTPVTFINGNGYPVPDADHDCFPDCFDPCPTDPEKNYETGAGCCGCGASDVDSDGDELPDCLDLCPIDPAKTAPDICGCGVSDVDSDGDGVLDCNEQCKADSKKTVPGVCGCGVSDVDSDGDGAADCNDQCPSDSKKSAPGVCGCLKSDADTNNNNIADCQESCLGVIDRCGVCNGTNSCVDCANVPNGTSVKDDFGTCCQPGQIDACGACFGDGSSCKPCVEATINFEITVSKDSMKAQIAFLNRMIRTLEQSNCGRQKDGKRFAKQARTNASKLSKSSLQVINKVPVTVNSCLSPSCADVSNKASIQNYLGKANDVLDLTSKVINTRVACALGKNGKCSGSAASCAKRVRSRIGLQRLDLGRARRLFKQTNERVKTVPLTTKQCV